MKRLFHSSLIICRVIIWMCIRASTDETICCRRLFSIDDYLWSTNKKKVVCGANYRQLNSKILDTKLNTKIFACIKGKLLSWWQHIVFDNVTSDYFFSSAGVNHSVVDNYFVSAFCQFYTIVGSGSPCLVTRLLSVIANNIQ